MKNTFEQDGVTYQIMIGRMIFNKKTITDTDILQDKQLRKTLLDMAWTGPLGRRDESEFHKNGIFKIVYGQNPEEEERLINNDDPKTATPKQKAPREPK